jgi:hypothetical protein
MKNLKLLLLLLLLTLSFSDLKAQDGNYSMLIVKQTITAKGMKTLYQYDIKHYVGNNLEIDLTKDRSGIDVNNIVDALNDLYKKGWKLVNVLMTNNLRSDDTDASLSGKNTVYYQYILSK